MEATGLTHFSEINLHRTGNRRTTVLLNPFTSMLVANLIISPFRTEEATSRWVRCNESISALTCDFSKQVQVHQRTP